MRCRANVLFRVAVAWLALGLPCAATADDYPNKPIRIIVPWPAGGVADVATRRVAAKMEPLLGQPLVIENKPGASGMIGADFVAKAPPDGYTILRGDMVTHAVDPYLFKTIMYDAIKDFAPVSAHARGPMILVVNPGLPVQSVADLIAYSKAHPRSLNFGAPLGAPQHLAAELLKHTTGADISHIPYKGEAPALTDVVAGQIQLMFVFPSVGGPFVKAGKLRAIATTSGKRIRMLPEVPTFNESGFPELEVTAWGAFFAPAGTPRPIIDKLNAAIRKGMQDPEVQELLHLVGAEALTGSPEELAAMLKVEMERWAQVVKRAGVKIE